MKITLNFAQDIGLVPRATDPILSYSGLYLFESIAGREERQRQGETKYKRENQRIVNEYCVDKELLHCEFPRRIIESAVNKIRNKK